MAVSPSVTVKELDFSKSVQNPATGIVGYAGVFSKGPVFSITNISNERELVDIFGKPTDSNYQHFFTCKSILNYSNGLRVVRAVNDDTGSGINQALNAGIVVSDGTGAVSATSDYIEDYSNHTETFAGDEELKIYATNPGSWGNSIKVAVANYTDFSTAEILNGVSFVSQFENGPEATDEIAIAVIDNTDGNNTIVEKYVVSLTSGSKDVQGNNNYIEDKINGNSAFILTFLASGTTDIESFEAASLQSGADGDTPDDGDITKAYNLFSDVDNVDINYLVSGGNESDTLRKLVDSIAVARKDCIAFIGAKQADIVGVSTVSTVVTNLVTDVETLAINSSYSAYFGNYMQIYDAYNDKKRWCNISGEILGLKIANNTNTETWFGQFSFTRGILVNPLKLGFSPNQAQRDTLYKAKINPIYTDKSAGHVLLGQKTLLGSSSSFNRINVRELFIYCEKGIALFARDYLAEFNDTITQTLFKSACEQFLRDIQSRRGISDFRVICDSTNNTPQVLANNEFRAEIAIRPNPVTEFITLTFYNVGQGVEFNEILG